MNLTEDQNTQLIHTTNENIRTISEILQKGVDAGDFIPTLDVRQVQNAIWGLLNGITEFVDQHRRARSTDHRLDSAWFGPGAALKEKAFHQAMKLAA